MVNRIRQLLEARQLTPTQFADVIGVARPIVSHILSGRNKPSLEVVQRILAAMPDLAMSWLLNGTGPMFALPAGSSPAVVNDAPIISPENGVGTPSEVRSRPRAQFVAPSRAGALAAKAQSLPLAALTATVARPAPKRFARLPSAPKNGQTTAGLRPTSAVPPALAVAPPAPGVETLGSVPAAASDVHPLPTALAAGTDKLIRRIVIFYQDGSFADFKPE